jgi:hypothetical protein
MLRNRILLITLLSYWNQIKRKNIKMMIRAYFSNNNPPGIQIFQDPILWNLIWNMNYLKSKTANSTRKNSRDPHTKLENRWYPLPIH